MYSLFFQKLCDKLATKIALHGFTKAMVTTLWDENVQAYEAAPALDDNNNTAFLIKDALFFHVKGSGWELSTAYPAQLTFDISGLKDEEKKGLLEISKEYK